jgi:hypothetical protein
MESREEVLLGSLRRFYADKTHLRDLTDLLQGTTKNRLSLRILDWLVTNYSKKYNVIYQHKERTVNIFLDYKAQLRGLSKKCFDPFCRRERISFEDADGKAFQTTIGQLCFFRWALSMGVVAYAIEHCSAIETDMLGSIRHRRVEDTDPTMFPINTTPQTTETDQEDKKEPAKLRRRELSRAAVKSHTHTSMAVTVSFQ